MKKWALMILVMILTGCGVKEEPVVEVEEVIVEVPERKHEGYVVAGRYYPSDRLLITSDGNGWEYQTDEVSETVPYDGMPVFAVFDDEGTDDIYDDIVQGLVLDRETAIYDKLEASFSEVENWEITRTGNHIHIDLKEE